MPVKLVSFFITFVVMIFLLISTGIPTIEGKRPHLCNPTRRKAPPGTCNIQNGNILCRKLCMGPVDNGYYRGFEFGYCRAAPRGRYCECSNCRETPMRF
ncbi:hypothetical protein ISN45_Aa07g002230 [Arabidopsis thaliana x Arabidopsis arenosa]|uniref:Uncharacterized protein n=1 Tax=Arabidopsis thaliana x Arabidopsis arenosa TaxID=1240361 RepID=A0A8T1Y3W7_9BRAS|nr:hypothetical protein ISN45_Aa07g002230 [Arabidopsis thaliana x Arabidopsis arenosa]